jgi:hypothetical protein
MERVTGMRMLKGHAGEQIALLAKEEKIDVMGTGIAGMLNFGVYNV